VAFGVVTWMDFDDHQQPGSDSGVGMAGDAKILLPRDRLEQDQFGPAGVVEQAWMKCGIDS